MAPIEFAKEPDWWQGDDTPVDEQGRSLKFICQADLVDILTMIAGCMFSMTPGTKEVKTYIKETNAPNIATTKA